MANAAKPERIELSVTPAQKDAFARAADARGQAITEFIIAAASVEAQEALANRSAFASSNEQSTAFVAPDLPMRAKSRLAELLKSKSILE